MPKLDYAAQKELTRVDSSFVDYSRFEGDPHVRVSQREGFERGRYYVPTFDYPRLEGFRDDESIREKKTNIYDAVLQLEASRGSGALSEEKYRIYIRYHELRLQKIMLVEAARDMREAGSSSAQEVARQSFIDLNEAIYGSYDVDAYGAMLGTEIERVANWIPHDGRSKDIQDVLTQMFSHSEFASSEETLITDEQMEKLNQFVRQKYAYIFEVVSDTDDEVVYDATGCAQIINDALAQTELADAGWVCEVNPNKANPATNADAKKVYLPTSTRRSASQLRRLIIHEVEVHARRAYNGSTTGFRPLEKGTADYADVEEGLGVFLEIVLDGRLDNPSLNRARDRYITAGLALGADGPKRDARATYEALWRLIAVREAGNGDVTDEIEESARSQAMAHVENAYRGTSFAAPGVIYTKLKVYWEGLMKNVSYFLENLDKLDDAFSVAMQGKYDHTNPRERVQIDNVIGLIKHEA